MESINFSDVFVGDDNAHHRQNIGNYSGDHNYTRHLVTKDKQLKKNKPNDVQLLPRYNACARSWVRADELLQALTVSYHITLHPLLQN